MAAVCSLEVIRGVGVIMKLCERLGGRLTSTLFFLLLFSGSTSAGHIYYIPGVVRPAANARSD